MSDQVELLQESIQSEEVLETRAAYHLLEQGELRRLVDTREEYWHMCEALGHVALEDYRTTRDGREHFLFTASLQKGDGYRHTAYVTEPAKGEDDGLSIVILPGLGEFVHDGIGAEFSRWVARKVPRARTMTIASNGVGKIGDRTPAYGIDLMAQQRSELITALNAHRSLWLIGVSMGTVILNKILDNNLSNGGELAVEQVTYFDPALVPPICVPLAMGLFPTAMAIDTGIQLLRTPIKEVPRLLKTLWHSRPSSEDLPAMRQQSIDLAKGIPEKEIRRVVDNYQVTVIPGWFDTVALAWHWKLREKSQRRADGANLKVVSVWRGHAMALDAKDSAEKVIKEMNARVSV